MSNSIPGWYVNPENDDQECYWDGQQWSEHTRERKTAPDTEGVVSTSGFIKK